MLKRIIPALLAAVMLCGCSSAEGNQPPVLDEARHAAALEEFWGETANLADTPAEQFARRYDNVLEGIVITNYKGDSDDVRVPAEIDGQPVIKVDLRTCYKNIKSLIIPDSVRDVRLASYDDMVSHYKDENLTPDPHLSYYYLEHIDGCVVTNYYGASNIVRIPEKLVNPDDNSESWTVKRVRMNNCERELSLLIIPDTVELLEAEPYKDIVVTASELKSQIEENLPDISERHGIYSSMGVERINIPAALFQDRRITFAHSTLTDVFVPETLTTLPDGLFMNCPLLERAVIGAEEVIVGKHAFFGCSRLTDVDISRAVSIGEWAFSQCSALTDVSFGNRLTSIGSGAFLSCDSLTSVYITASVEHIGSDVFGECTKLDEITVDAQNKHYTYTNSILSEK